MAAWHRWIRALVFVALASAACSTRETGKKPQATGSANLAPPPPRVVEEPPQPEPERDACLIRMAELSRAEPLPGTPTLDARRSRILARAKGTPVLMVREPQPSEHKRAARLRRQIESAKSPGFALYDVYPRLAREPALARGVLLREGYLYAESPGKAAALAYAVRLQHLFRDKEIFIHRGSSIIRARRVRAKYGDYYVYADGPERDQEAQILFLDRVASSRKELDEPLHRDVLTLGRELGFDRMSVDRILPEAMLARLRYGDVWVPSVLGTDGASVSLECEVLPAEETARERMMTARRNAQRMERILARHRAVIGEQIDEALPFDEPKTEFGQQDGKLRQEWTSAYRYGHWKFEFNEDEYKVFDHRGRPRVPQVCIDFIRDTYERAAGTWFKPKGEAREWVRGLLAFKEFGMENERSVESFVKFTESHPEWFDVWNLDERDRIPLIERRDFYNYLFNHRDDFKPGDVVIILGLRDDEKMHYHSFFVYEADPITGMPTLVAANAGRPRIRAWDTEMSNAPLRSIKTRIRPRLDWLEAVTAPEPPEAKLQKTATDSPI